MTTQRTGKNNKAKYIIKIAYHNETLITSHSAELKLMKMLTEWKKNKKQQNIRC